MGKKNLLIYYANIPGTSYMSDKKEYIAIWDREQGKGIAIKKETLYKIVKDYQQEDLK